MDIIVEVYCDGDEVLVLDNGNILLGVVRAWCIDSCEDDNGNPDYKLMYDVDVVVLGDKLTIQVEPGDLLDRETTEVDTLIDIMHKE